MDGGEQQEEEVTPILHREIPRRGMEIILVVLILTLLFFVFVAPTCNHGHDARPVVDISNIRQALHAIHIYAVDHEGQLPTHIHLAADYIEDSDDSFFISRYDHEESLSFDKTIKAGWYPYGSYWFLSTDRFNLDSDIESGSIVLAYRTPRNDNDFYIVGFMDGHVEMLGKEEFDELMNKQEELIDKINEPEPAS